jgi:hypothetical protein
MRHPTSPQAEAVPAPAYRITDREIAYYVKEAQALRRQAIAEWARRGGEFLRRALANASGRFKSAEGAAVTPIVPSTAKARS